MTNLTTGTFTTRAQMSEQIAIAVVTSGKAFNTLRLLYQAFLSETCHTLLNGCVVNKNKFSNENI